MKKICFVGIFAFAIFSSFAADWKLVWSDEFDIPGLPDPAKWNYETGFVRNHEAQYYTASRLENARVENGCLVIEARKESSKDPAFKDAAYTSASLTTRDRFSWKYGRVEVRAKLSSGRGVWPAIWTLGTNISSVGWPACGEIDIMEMVGFRPDMVYGHVHSLETVKTKKVKDGAALKVPGASEDFHVYAIEWDPNEMDLFVDGKKYYSYHNPHTGEAAWPFDKDQYLILNLAIGGAWGGAKGIDDTIFPQRFYIDYVHIYQKQ